MTATVTLNGNISIWIKLTTKTVKIDFGELLVEIPANCFNKLIKAIDEIPIEEYNRIRDSQIPI